MKTKKKVLIGLMALCLAGGVGTVFATAGLQHKSGSNYHQAATDKAIYLDWDSGSKTSITAVEQKAVGEKDYRSLSVLLTKSATLTGTVTVTLTLTPATETDKTATLSGLTVKAYETASKEDCSVANYAFDETGKDAKATVVGGAAASNGSFTINLSSDVTWTNNSGAKHYVLVFAFADGGLGQNDIFSGRLSIAQSYAA